MSSGELNANLNTDSILSLFKLVLYLKLLSKILSEISDVNHAKYNIHSIELF